MLTFHNRWNIEKFPFQVLPEMQTMAVTPLQKSLLHYQEMADNNKTDLRENKNGDPAANGAANNLQENWKSSDRPTRGAYTYDVHAEGGGVETYSVRWVVLLVIHSVVIYSVEHFWHVPPAVGRILQLLCSPMARERPEDIFVVGKAVCPCAVCLLPSQRTSFKFADLAPHW